jgi:hypothetical protein
MGSSPWPDWNLELFLCPVSINSQPATRVTAETPTWSMSRPPGDSPRLAVTAVNVTDKNNMHVAPGGCVAMRRGSNHPQPDPLRLQLMALQSDLLGRRRWEENVLILSGDHARRDHPGQSSSISIRCNCCR